MTLTRGGDVPALGFILLMAACGTGGGGGDDVVADDVVDECSEAADDCSGDTLCIGGSCEAAFGRIYDVTDIDVTLPTTDGNGEAWDVGGGAPDIFVVLVVNGASGATTTAIQDQFSASFSGPFAVTPIGGGDLWLDVYDEDVTSDDLAYSCGADPITAALLRDRVLGCQSAGASLTFSIEPR